MSEMSLEERALRHADEFFTSPRLWWQDGQPHGGAAIGMVCVGLLLQKYYRAHGPESALDIACRPAFEWASKVLGVEYAPRWNDALPSFKAMKLALKARIKYHKGMRT